MVAVRPVAALGAVKKRTFADVSKRTNGEDAQPMKNSESLHRSVGVPWLVPLFDEVTPMGKRDLNDGVANSSPHHTLSMRQGRASEMTRL